MWDSKGTKGNVIVDDFRLTTDHTVTYHGGRYFLHIRNALTVDLKDALKDFADSGLMC